ncbi:MAG: phospholipase [Sphingobacteriales bacterium]|nr:MAG: phospholipase [Sphingobacteriales bacterium]
MTVQQIRQQETGYRQAVMISTSAYIPGNRVQLIRGGKAYFDLLLKLINEANDCIHLQTYIYDGDETGQMIADALVAASARSVKVYLMADGYASQSLHQPFIDELRSKNIEFRYFEPVFRSKKFYFGRRLHHKLFVADTKYALVGGINISDRYNDMPDEPAWLDYALFTEGPIVQQLCVLCWKTWLGFTRMGLTPCEENNIQFNIPAEEQALIRMRRNDWVRRKNNISATYIEMFTKSQSHITILCSYFLPGRVIRRNIIKAVKRGVKIKVILAGLSDIKMAKLAERWMYDWLLRNRIEIYEYQPTVLHGKLAVCDSEWMTGGSYNINDISAYASIELNLDVRKNEFALQTEKILEELCEKDCIKITREYHLKKKNIFFQFSRWVSYEIYRLTLYFFTFYFKNEN